MADKASISLALLGITAFVLSSATGQDFDTDGESLFSQYCASCHGPIGEGDGPVADAMVITVPNLRTLRARSDGSFPRDAVMRYIDGRDLPAAHGDRMMPVWGDTFADIPQGSEADVDVATQRIQAITEFIERLQN